MDNEDLLDLDTDLLSKQFERFVFHKSLFFETDV